MLVKSAIGTRSRNAKFPMQFWTCLKCRHPVRFLGIEACTCFDRNIMRLVRSKSQSIGQRLFNQSETHYKFSSTMLSQDALHGHPGHQFKKFVYLKWHLNISDRPGFLYCHQKIDMPSNSWTHIGVTQVFPNRTLQASKSQGGAKLIR